MKADITTLDAKKAGTVELPDHVFALEPRPDILARMVRYQLAKRRSGTAHVKDRSEVNATTAKMYRQKGTGRARQGSTRASQWKGGGKPFGPTPRSYDKRMPAAMRRAALREALAARIAAGGVSVIDALSLPEPKTKSLTSRLASLGIEVGPTLLVVAELDAGLARAARNVPWLEVEIPSHTSVYQVLRHPRVIFEKAALLALQTALTPPATRPSAPRQEG